MKTPNSFRFSMPPKNAVANANVSNFVRFTPSSGNVFRSDQSAKIEIPVASSDLFMRSDKSYLKFTLTPRKSDGSVINSTSSSVATTQLGLASCFQRTTLQVGGTVAEDINNYPVLLAEKYSRATDEAKQALKITELYEKTDYFASSGSAPNTSVKGCHPISFGMFMSSQNIPLPVIRQGLTVELYLAPADTVFTNFGSAVSYYEISDVSLVACMTKPDPGYMSSILGAMSKGQALTIPYSTFAHQSVFGNGSTEQQLQISTNSAQSVQAITVLGRTNSTLGTQSNDKYANFADLGITEWSLENGTKQYPQGLAWKNATDDPETFIIGLINDDLYAPQLSSSLTEWTGDKTWTIHYNFKSDLDTWADGLDTRNDPVIKVSLKSGSAFASTSRFDCFLTVDRVCLVSNEQTIVINSGF